MRPWPAPLFNGEGRWRDPGRFVCHCLLIEGAQELVLVDAGVGLADIADPTRLGWSFRTFLRPTLDPEMTAVRQIQRLGYSPADVGHIVLTHLDADHVGGLADFPHARVHVYAAEYEAAIRPRTLIERERYRPAQFEHGVNWVHHAPQGERWYGFDGVRLPIDREAEILLVPLTGHSRGHAGVAVHDGTRWLLDAGDAYFTRHEVRARSLGGPLGRAVLRNVVAADNATRRRNVSRLRSLVGKPDLEIFCAHDEHELDHCGTS